MRGLLSGAAESLGPRALRVVRRAGRRLLTRRARPLSAMELAKPAVVFAPHPDDETLGCGGTIARKRSVGAQVSVVFMTDGAESHAGLMPRAELRALRRSEARAACAELGVDEAHVFFLDFPDGDLSADVEAARQRVVDVLQELRPRQVFVPYRLEPPRDHAATAGVVDRAIAELPSSLRREVFVLEYPVWYWDHWPWMRQVGWRRGFGTLRRARFGLPLWRDLGVVSVVDGFLGHKRRALAAYRTQMTAPNGDPRWSTLPDVASGDFLECFLSGSEYFFAPRPRDKARLGDER